MSVISGYSATTRSSGALSDDETAYDDGFDAASVSTMDRTVSTLEPITADRAAGGAEQDGVPRLTLAGLQPIR